MIYRRNLLGSPIYFLALVSIWRTLSGGIRCLFVDFDASLDSEGIRKRERFRIFRISGIRLLVVVGSCENGDWRVLQTRQVRARGESRRRRRKRRKRSCGDKQYWGSSSHSCSYSSVDGFASHLGVGVAVRFALLIGIAYAARSFGFISASLWRQLLTPDTTRRCESIVPLSCSCRPARSVLAASVLFFKM